MIKLSAVIPTIGRKAYFDIALGSLLEQREDFHELVVFDNSSGQTVRGESRFADRSDVTWLTSERSLPAIESWNTAVRLCTGRHVTVFGDDDQALPDYAAGLKERLNQADLVIAPYDVIDAAGALLVRQTPAFANVTATEFRHRRMTGRLPLVIPGVAFRRDTFLELGGFRDTGLPKFIHTDDDLWFRMAERAGGVASVDHVTWRYRWHSGQVAGGHTLDDFAHAIARYTAMLESGLAATGAGGGNIYPVGRDVNWYRASILVARFHVLWFREGKTARDTWGRRRELLRDLSRLPLTPRNKAGALLRVSREMIRLQTKHWSRTPRPNPTS